MGIKVRRGLLLLAIISVVGALMLSVGVTSPKKAEADYCGWVLCPPPPPPVTISIPDATSEGASPANPYPSEINVQGLSGTITDVNVTLNGFSHGFPDDVAVQVVSPGPTGKSVLLMSDVGGPLPSGSAPVSNINLTLDDEAANSLSDSTQLTTGTYKPTKGTTPTELPSGWEDNPVPNSWSTPAPDLTVSGSQLSSFDGKDPNGIWKLYVIDDTRFSQGAFAGGWSLELNNTTTIDNSTTTPPETSITSADEGSSSATFGFSSTEQGSTFQCQLSKDETVTQAWAACTSPKSYSNLTSGNYMFEVKATDSDGMVDQTPASRNWTITSPPETAPTVIPNGTVPTANATKVDRTTNVTATFSEDMMASSINSNTFKLFKKGSTTKISATVSYDPTTGTAKLNPFGSTTTRLARGATYKAVVTTGAKDLAGNSLDQDQDPSNGLQQKKWLFTTTT
jgi:subtilisin-like proprotein convertase family protein